MRGLWLKKLKECFSQKALGYMAVIGGFLVQLTLGSIYTYGNMAPYIIRFMNTSSGSAGYITVGNSTWIFGLAVFGLGASMSLGGFIENKLGPISTVLMGCWIMSFGVLITAVTIKVHIVLICVTYGLFSGIGSGIAYGVSLTIPSEWFPQSKGLVSGIIVSGFGMGSMIFDFLQAYYVNPDIHKVEIQDVSKVTSSFLIFGSAYAVLQLIGSIMITRPDDSLRETSDQSVCRSMDLFSDELMPCTEVNISPHRLMYELDFWILWITYALNSVVALLVLSLHKVFGKSMGIVDMNLVFASAFGGFCNGTGRIMWGYFNDRVTYKTLMTILTTLMAVFLGTFYLCALIQNEDVKYLVYIIWVVLLHLVLSGNFSLFPTICVKTFGLKNFTENYGILFTAYSFSGILTCALTTGLLETSESKLFMTPFLIGCVFSILSGVITMYYRGKSLIYKNLNL